MKGLLKWRKEGTVWDLYYADVPAMPGYQYGISAWDGYFNDKKTKRATVWLAVPYQNNLIEFKEILFSLRDAKKVAEDDFLNRFPLIALSRVKL